MTRPPSKTAQLVTATIDEQIISLSLAGKSTNEIAAELDVDASTVQRRTTSLLIDYNTKLAEKVEILGLRELARLDYLYREVLPSALGGIDPISGEARSPDHRLLGVILKIIGEKRQWITLQQSRVRDEDHTAFSVDKVEITFTGSSSMYNTAVANISPDTIADSEISVDRLYELAAGDVNVRDAIKAATAQTRETDDFD